MSEGGGNEGNRCKLQMLKFRSWEAIGGSLQASWGGCPGLLFFQLLSVSAHALAVLTLIQLPHTREGVMLRERRGLSPSPDYITIDRWWRRGETADGAPEAGGWGGFDLDPWSFFFSYSLSLYIPCVSCPLALSVLIGSSECPDLKAGCAEPPA